MNVVWFATSCLSSSGRSRIVPFPLCSWQAARVGWCIRVVGVNSEMRLDGDEVGEERMDLPQS